MSVVWTEPLYIFCLSIGLAQLDLEARLPRLCYRWQQFSKTAK